MTTSLISGLPRRETWTHWFFALPWSTVSFWRSVAAQHADRVVAAVVELRLRDLQRDRVHAVAGEEVLPASGRAGACSNRDEIEDRADVGEECIVTLTGECGHAVAQGVDPLGGERRVVRSRARADVVRRRLQVRSDDGRMAARHLRDRVGLLGVPEEELPCVTLEPEVVRRVRLRVAVSVDVDAVPRRRAERVVVRPGRGILARNPVGDDRDGVRLVRRHECVQVGVVRTRVLRDQRRFPVTRRLRRAGTRAL